MLQSLYPVLPHTVAQEETGTLQRDLRPVPTQRQWPVFLSQVGLVHDRTLPHLSSAAHFVVLAGEGETPLSLP